jgi:hypothetical protein
MIEIIALSSLGGIAGLVLLELVEQIRGGSGRLHDRYHEE